MKICIIAYINPPDYGDACIHSWEIISNLAKLHNDVSVILPEINVGGMQDFVSFYFIKKHHLPKRLFRLWFVLASTICYLKLEKKNKFDVVYTRSLQNGVLLSIFRKMFNARLILEVNGIPRDEYALSAKGLSKYVGTKTITALFRFNMQRADGIRVVTTGIRDGIAGMGICNTKIAVIGNGVNPLLFKPIPNTRDKLNFGNDEKIIIFVGQFHIWQGLEFLIGAARSILQRVPKAKFIVVGDGEMRPIWEKKVSELRLDKSFVFTGLISPVKVPTYINAADVCVAPFIRERNEKIGLSPLKLYQYMACGKPVVASNIKGVGDLITDSKSGIAVEPENSDDLGDAIVRLLLGEKLREEMGQNGRRLALEEYSWKTIAEKVEELCKKTAYAQN